MPRQLAILVFTVFVIWLWRQDAKTRPQFSKALWIPLIWVLILGSHPIGWWLTFFFGIGSTGGSNLEGSPINSAFYSLLIFASIVVVARRGVSWGKVIRNNLGLSLFFAYLAVTILWSDFPVATTKRWIKEIGAIPVLLVILTEERPLEAIETVFTRVAFVLFSYSVLAIKYVPEIGRTYSGEGGLQVIGISEQKNSLGEITCICCIILLWQLLEYCTANGKRFYRAPAVQWVITFAMGLWLLYQCDSKTSILCLTLGSAILLSTRIPLLARNPKTVLGFCLLIFPLFLTLNSLFNISDSLLRILGRNPTLTNRTEIWAAIREHPVNPLLGSGFLNYWDALGQIEIEGYYVSLKTAHNGYLELYLDGGMIGIVFLILMLLHAGATNARAYVQAAPAGALAFAFYCMTLVANISESLYARRTPLWECFLLFCLCTSGAAFLANAAAAEQRSWGGQEATKEPIFLASPQNW